MSTNYDGLTRTEVVEFTAFFYGKMRDFTYAQVEGGIMININAAFDEWKYLRETDAYKQVKKEHAAGGVTATTREAFEIVVHGYKAEQDAKLQKLADESKKRGAKSWNKNKKK